MRREARASRQIAVLVLEGSDNLLERGLLVDAGEQGDGHDAGGLDVRVGELARGDDEVVVVGLVVELDHAALGDFDGDAVGGAVVLDLGGHDGGGGNAVATCDDDALLSHFGSFPCLAYLDETRGLSPRLIS